DHENVGSVGQHGMVCNRVACERDPFPIGRPVRVIVDGRTVRDVNRFFLVVEEAAYPGDEDVAVPRRSACEGVDRTSLDSWEGRGARDRAREARRRPVECDVLAVRRPTGGTAPGQQLLAVTCLIHQEQVPDVEGDLWRDLKSVVPVAVEHDPLSVPRKGWL